MRLAVGGLFIVLGIAVIVLTRQPEDAEGVAGVAYVENDAGDWVLADGERPNDRVVLDGSDEEWLTKWTLTERTGAQLGSQELKGQPYVAGFFFSTCPSICVQQNGKVKELQDKYSGRPIRFVSISCDPEVDSPEVLSEYADRFQADPEQWLFFTGSMDYIRRVGAEFFSLGVMRRGHPEKFALVDRDGKVFGLYTWSDDNQWNTLQQDMDQLLSSGPGDAQ